MCVVQHVCTYWEVVTVHQVLICMYCFNGTYIYGCNHRLMYIYILLLKYGL